MNAFEAFEISSKKEKLLFQEARESIDPIVKDLYSNIGLIAKEGGMNIPFPCNLSEIQETVLIENLIEDGYGIVTEEKNIRLISWKLKYRNY